MASVGDAVEAESQGCRSHSGQHVAVPQQSLTERPKPSSAINSSLRDIGQLRPDLQRPEGAGNPSSPGSPTTLNAMATEEPNGIIQWRKKRDLKVVIPLRNVNFGTPAYENFLKSSDRVAEEENDDEWPRSSGDAD